MGTYNQTLGSQTPATMFTDANVVVVPSYVSERTSYSHFTHFMSFCLLNKTTNSIKTLVWHIPTDIL